MGKRYKVEVEYTFKGYYVVKAETKEEAKELVDVDCGLVMGGDIHTILDDEDVNWAFNVHPDTKIGKITVEQQGIKKK